MTLPRLGAAALAAFLALAGCGVSETYEPTYEARVQINPARYPIFVATLDAEMGRFALTRYNASMTLRELYKEHHGRDVLAFAYQFKLEDKVPFLNVSDVQKVGVLRVIIVPEALLEENARRQAMSRVEVILAGYGAKLEPFKRTELKRE